MAAYGAFGAVERFSSSSGRLVAGPYARLLVLERSARGSMTTCGQAECTGSILSSVARPCQLSACIIADVPRVGAPSRAALASIDQYHGAWGVVEASACR